jgi:hypothetical protein
MHIEVVILNTWLYAKLEGDLKWFLCIGTYPNPKFMYEKQKSFPILLLDHFDKSKYICALLKNCTISWIECIFKC